LELAADVVVIGGTSGIGRELAATYVARGARVTLSGRDAARAQEAAAGVGDGARGIAFDLEEPHTIAGALADVESVDRLALVAVDRDENTVTAYDVDRAIRLATLKLVGYTEVVHQLADRLTPDASILVFGGLAKDRPYPGSTTVTTVNGAVSTLIRTLALELAPVRVNAIHPGIVGDSPYWSGKDEFLANVRARTPTGRNVRMQDIVEASVFLLENEAMNGANLEVDGGWMMQ
jgi:NAD(P)-dependent dehydrogenase (short-subunit alcohol dehydrogenase family)